MPASIPIAPRYHPTVRTVLTLAYIAGVIGLQLPGLAVYFRPLSPFTLISSLVVLLLYHTDWRPAFYLYLVLAVLTGYFIELLGVHTGLIFGHYAYGWGLGFRLWEVPPVIGINWLALSYCCGSVCSHLKVPTYAKVIAAATLMVVLDFFIEPVAVELDFWTWFDQPVPLRNYIGWWLVSAVLFSVWYALPFRKENRLAKWLLTLQFLFFISHNLFIFLRK
ncbi:carotenoid biosynthesis protein [Spirosoma soli]|uniref:Carotenoid biosynthesis protein n=1 Tax=Spirosoma soli TaxID=1770529 RepID=A0ABW5M6Y8_9BACT